MKNHRNEFIPFVIRFVCLTDIVNIVRHKYSDKSYCLFTHFTELLFDENLVCEYTQNMLFNCVWSGATWMLWKKKKRKCTAFELRWKFWQSEFSYFPSVKSDEHFWVPPHTRPKKQIFKSDSLAFGKTSRHRIASISKQTQTII